MAFHVEHRCAYRFIRAHTRVGESPSATKARPAAKPFTHVAATVFHAERWAAERPLPDEIVRVAPCCGVAHGCRPRPASPSPRKLAGRRHGPHGASNGLGATPSPPRQASSLHADRHSAPSPRVRFRHRMRLHHHTPTGTRSPAIHPHSTTNPPRDGRPIPDRHAHVPPHQRVTNSREQTRSTWNAFAPTAPTKTSQGHAECCSFCVNDVHNAKQQSNTHIIPCY